MTSILDLIQQDGFNPKRQASTNGGEYACPCPWCGGKDRFRIWPESNRYWCRVCDRRGDAIQYLRDYRSMNFNEACQVIGREPWPKVCSTQPRRTGWEPRELESPSEIWQGIMARFILWAGSKLVNDHYGHVTRFLREKRHISTETFHSFLIGWNPGDIYIPREKLDLPDYERDKIWLPAGIVVLYADGSGLYRVRIRRFSGKPRYYFVPGGSSAPMVIDGNARAAIVVESELDAILLSQEAGNLCRVVALGNAQIKPDNRVCELIQEAEIVLISLDSDNAGAWQFWGWWFQQFPKARRWPVIKGNDPTEAMNNGLNLRDWVFAGLIEQYG